jgi:hypothetical protein
MYQAEYQSIIHFVSASWIIVKIRPSVIDGIEFSGNGASSNGSLGEVASSDEDSVDTAPDAGAADIDVNSNEPSDERMLSEADSLGAGGSLDDRCSRGLVAYRAAWRRLMIRMGLRFSSSIAGLPIQMACRRVADAYGASPHRTMSSASDGHRGQGMVPDVERSLPGCIGKAAHLHLHDRVEARPLEHDDCCEA